MKQSIKKIIKGINFASTLTQAKVANRYIPLALFFLITEKCNLRCPYCYIRFQNPLLEELSTEAIIRTIDEFYRLGTRYICIMGGEPLIRPDLEAIGAHLATLNVMSDIITNGLLIHQQIDALKKFDSVCVSLEGTEETHDRDRGHGTYARILKNLELLRENSIRLRRFNVTVTKNTIKTLRHVMGIAKKYNISATISLATVNAGKESEILPDAEMIRDFWMEVRRLKTSGYPIEKSLFAIDTNIRNAHLFLKNEIYEKDPADIYGYKPCLFGRYLCYLGADGTIFPCCHPDIFGKRSFDSNIFERGVKSAWENVVKNTHCKFCSLVLGCEMDYFFNLDVRSIFEAAYTYMIHR